MIRTLRLALPISAVALLVAGSAFAGGASCGAKDEAHPAATSTTSTTTSAGHHCSGVSDASSMAKACGVKAGQSIYSFAVPTAECDHCVTAIQTALMAQKGVSCAHVDLTNRTAYIIADRGVDKKAIAKTIQTAGFKNRFKGEGAKVQAEFAKAMTAGDKGINSCQRKEKDKV
jgi:copper chaperone CopZ